MKQGPLKTDVGILVRIDEDDYSLIFDGISGTTTYLIAKDTDANLDQLEIGESYRLHLDGNDQIVTIDSFVPDFSAEAEESHTTNRTEIDRQLERLKAETKPTVKMPLNLPKLKALTTLKPTETQTDQKPKKDLKSIITEKKRLEALKLAVQWSAGRSHLGAEAVLGISDLFLEYIYAESVVK